MKVWLRVWIFSLVFGSCIWAFDTSAQSACPPAGDNPSPRLQALDRLKNRATAPAILHTRSLTTFLAPGDDRARWSEDQGVVVVGYVADVTPGGLESVNCHAKELVNRDTHIVLVAKLGDAPKTGMVVEVTPFWRKEMASRGIDWSTATLKKALWKKCVEVRGWVFLDREHVNASHNTAPHGKHNWRQTAFEIHPITGLAVVEMVRCTTANN